MFQNILLIQQNNIKCWYILHLTQVFSGALEMKVWIPKNAEAEKTFEQKNYFSKSVTKSKNETYVLHAMCQTSNHILAVYIKVQGNSVFWRFDIKIMIQKLWVQTEHDKYFVPKVARYSRFRSLVGPFWTKNSRNFLLFVSNIERKMIFQ